MSVWLGVRMCECMSVCGCVCVCECVCCHLGASAPWAGQILVRFEFGAFVVHGVSCTADS